MSETIDIKGQIPFSQFADYAFKDKKSFDEEKSSRKESLVSQDMPLSTFFGTQRSKEEIVDAQIKKEATHIERFFSQTPEVQALIRAAAQTKILTKMPSMQRL